MCLSGHGDFTWEKLNAALRHAHQPAGGCGKPSSITTLVFFWGGMDILQGPGKLRTWQYVLNALLKQQNLGPWGGPICLFVFGVVQQLQTSNQAFALDVLSRIDKT